jgi:hypothetical protein
LLQQATDFDNDSGSVTPLSNKKQTVTIFVTVDEHYDAKETNE